MQAAEAALERVRPTLDALSSGDVATLVSACRKAMSSPKVAAYFCNVAGVMCGRDVSTAAANRVTCGAAGVISAVVLAMYAHGTGDVHGYGARVAAEGCWALSRLAQDNTVNADAIVLFGGLDVILSVMQAHAGDWVPRNACWALKDIADAAGPAALDVMRDSRAPELLEWAKRAYSSDELLTSKADRALRALGFLSPPASLVTPVSFAAPF